MIAGTKPAARSRMAVARSLRLARSHEARNEGEVSQRARAIPARTHERKHARAVRVWRRSVGIVDHEHIL